MLEIATHYNTIDYEVMLEYAKRADSCIKNIAPKHVGNEPYNRILNNQQARAYNLIDFSQHGLGNLTTAKLFYEKSLQRFELNDDLKRQASSLNNLGYLLNDMSKTEEAIRYYQKAVEIREKINDKIGLSNTINNIGLIYLSKKDYDFALKYFKQTLNLRTEVND
ncbi:MAG: tetratricopeptide repeat protein [Flavobacteriales bacterium]